MTGALLAGAAVAAVVMVAWWPRRRRRVGGVGRVADSRGETGGPVQGFGASRGARTRRERPGDRTSVAVVLDLLEVALAAGVPVPRALDAVGRAVGGTEGAALVRVAAALGLGAAWGRAWAGAPAGLAPVGELLGPSWSAGAPPGPALRRGAQSVRRARRRAAREAAGRLGVRLVLPLGVCFLPAFVLLGLVPVVLSLASGLW